MFIDRTRCGRLSRDLQFEFRFMGFLHFTQSAFSFFERFKTVSLIYYIRIQGDTQLMLKNFVVGQVILSKQCYMDIIKIAPMFIITFLP